MDYQKIAKVKKKSKQNNSKTVTNNNDKVMTKERHIYPKKRKRNY